MSGLARLTEAGGEGGGEGIVLEKVVKRASERASKRENERKTAMEYFLEIRRARPTGRQCSSLQFVVVVEVEVVVVVVFYRKSTKGGQPGMFELEFLRERERERS